jgi:hypothetical protein
MPSLYTDNGGIELIGLGEKAGAWGTTTNNNFSIIDRLINGVTDITLSGSGSSVTNLTTSDGSLSDGMFKVITFKGSPSGSIAVSVEPPDADKVYFVKNESGQTVFIRQGTHSSDGVASTEVARAVEIANGASAIVVANGGGSGATVTDISASFPLKSGVAASFTTVTASSAILPDASGDADIGSTSLEWGHIYIADDKKIHFGSDQDITMEYDEDGTDSLLISGGDVTIADDKKLFFGTDKDVSIEYDEDGNNTMLVTGDVVFADGSTSVDIKSHDLSANGLKLDGTLVTASAAELNHCDGVTSNIQTQLNTKVTSSGVTSVATGTGLTGGTITSTGTISINTGLGDVGTYAFLGISGSNTTITAGQTYTRSSSGANNNNVNLVYAGMQMADSSDFDDDTALDLTGSVTTGLDGVWRAMGEANNATRRSGTLFLRIS